MELLIEAWVCGCISSDELAEANYEYSVWQSEIEAEGAYLRDREYDPQADMDEAVWF